MHLGGEHAAHVEGDAVGNAHEGQVPTGAHAAQRLVERCFVADGLHDAIGPQAAGQRLDACNAFLAALLHDVGRTELAGQCLSVRVARHGDDAGGTQLAGTDDCAQAHRAVTHDDDGCAGTCPGLVGGEPAGAEHVGGCQE